MGDPPACWYPVRRSLAEALLAGGRTDAAAARRRRVLIRWPYDPLSLRLLSQAQGGRGSDAAQEVSLAGRNWVGDIRVIAFELL